MESGTVLSLGSLAVATMSVAIAAIALYKQENTRKLALASFKREFQKPYLEWRANITELRLELDPPKGQVSRSYTEKDRRIIRNYWPLVALVELGHLNSIDKKIIGQSWTEWEINLRAGFAHRSILQEFCYYSKYEDPDNPIKEELIKTVLRLYRSANKKELNCDEILEERIEYTQSAT